MIKKSYPLMFDITPQFSDSGDGTPTCDNTDWLNQVITQGRRLLDNWREDWPKSAVSPTSAAVDFAAKALDAMEHGRSDLAMACVFIVGREIERANRAFPIGEYFEQRHAADIGVKKGHKTQTQNKDARESKVVEIAAARVALLPNTPRRSLTTYVVDKMRREAPDLALGRTRVNEILRENGFKK
jgi:hypothetical protein